VPTHVVLVHPEIHWNTGIALYEVLRPRRTPA